VTAACPAEDELVRMVEGALAAESLSMIEAHVASCDACGQVIAELGALNRTADARRIGRYQLDRRIAAGGMGEIWAAWDPQLRREIAVKLVRPDRADDGRERERLLREARALARLGHPNVLAVHDVGEVDGEVFIATELVEGDTLASRGGANADWRQIARLYIQAARGLAAAHASGLVHRDVKPANLLLGADGRVRVADFGLAVRAQTDSPPAASELPDSPFESPLESVSITAAGHIAGTPAYMSPEQRLGAPVDARADQYALCVALAESIGGRRPTGDLDAANLVAFFAERRPREPELNALAAVLARGLEPDPDERFPDTGALADAIEDLVGVRHVSGGTPAIDLRHASMRLPAPMVSLSPPTRPDSSRLSDASKPASAKSRSKSRSESESESSSKPESKSRSKSRSSSKPESKSRPEAKSRSESNASATEKPRSRRAGIAFAAAAAAIGFTGVLVATQLGGSDAPRAAIGGNASAGTRPTATEIVSESSRGIGIGSGTGDAARLVDIGSGNPSGIEPGNASGSGNAPDTAPSKPGVGASKPIPLRPKHGASAPTTADSSGRTPTTTPTSGTPATGTPATGTGTPTGTGAPPTTGTGAPTSGSPPPSADTTAEVMKLLGEIPKTILRRDVKACRALLAKAPANVHPTFHNMLDTYRASCTMMAGDCAKGTAILAKVEPNPGGKVAPDIKARWVESQVNMYCPIEGSLDTRLTRMWAQLDAFTSVGTHSIAWCNVVLPPARKAATEVTDPKAKQLAAKILRRLASCVASAGRCDEARQLWQLSLDTDASRAPSTPALGSCP
jgi:serine/threonine protein kinase